MQISHYLVKYAVICIYLMVDNQNLIIEIWTLDSFYEDFVFLFLSLHKSENTVNSQEIMFYFVNKVLYKTREMINEQTLQ